MKFKRPSAATTITRELLAADVNYLDGQPASLEMNSTLNPNPAARHALFYRVPIITHRWTSFIFVYRFFELDNGTIWQSSMNWTKTFHQVSPLDAAGRDVFHYIQQGIVVDIMVNRAQPIDDDDKCDGSQRSGEVWQVEPLYDIVAYWTEPYKGTAILHEEPLDVRSQRHLSK